MNVINVAGLSLSGEREDTPLLPFHANKLNFFKYAFEKCTSFQLANTSKEGGGVRITSEAL